MRAASLGPWVAAFVLASCTLAREGGDAFPDTAVRLRSAVRVTEVVASSPREATLTSIHSLAVDSRGTIYVPDHFGQRVVVLAPDGSLLRMTGRRGGGPGEFQAVQSIQILAGDSLLVYDPAMGRATVFAPHSDVVAYTTLLTASGAAPWQVQRTRANDAYLARYRTAFTPGASQQRVDRIARLEADGSGRRDLLSFPSRASLIAGRTITPHPFGRQGLAQLDSQDLLHLVWSDSLAVARADLGGNPLPGFRLQYTPPPVTRADIDHALADFAPAERVQFEPVLIDSTPPRWPAVEDMLIDDRDRVWMSMSGSAARPVEWAAFSPAGSYLGSVLVPPGTKVRLIRSELLYAEELRDDVPYVVVYRMSRSVN